MARYLPGVEDWTDYDRDGSGDELDVGPTECWVGFVIDFEIGKRVKMREAPTRNDALDWATREAAKMEAGRQPLHTDKTYFGEVPEKGDQ